MADANGSYPHARINPQRFLNLVEAGHSAKRLAAEFGVSKNAIRWRAIELGVNSKVVANGVAERQAELEISSPRREDPRTPRKAYTDQAANAKRRGIEWRLSFEEWWGIWQASGKWEQRGRHQGGYVMSRFGDAGPYSIENVHIATNKQNTLEAMTRSQRRYGVYLESPGSKKPWVAAFRKKRLGNFETEAQARAARDAAVAEHFRCNGKSRGGWKWTEAEKEALREGAKERM